MEKVIIALLLFHLQDTLDLFTIIVLSPFLEQCVVAFDLARRVIVKCVLKP